MKIQIHFFTTKYKKQIKRMIIFLDRSVFFFCITFSHGKTKSSSSFSEIISHKCSQTFLTTGQSQEKTLRKLQFTFHFTFWNYMYIVFIQKSLPFRQTNNDSCCPPGPNSSRSLMWCFVFIVLLCLFTAMVCTSGPL